MRKLILGLTAAMAVSIVVGAGALYAADATPPQGPGPAAIPAPAPGAGAAVPAKGNVSAIDLEKSTPKGQLKNPYSDKISQVAAEGHSIFMGAGCNGCHGGGGGGGMCPPLTNDVWVYGPDDDTLFRLVTLGSVGLQAEGYTRKGSENVVGPMPPHGEIVKTADNLWKIIAWIRSVNPDSLKPASTVPPPPSDD